MSTFTESEERIELRAQVAKLASRYGREWFVERARAGEKTTELWMEHGECDGVRRELAAGGAVGATREPRERAGDVDLVGRRGGSAGGGVGRGIRGVCRHAGNSSAPSVPSA